jgi:hypothetical protein
MKWMASPSISVMKFGVQLRLAFAPVVVRRPVAGELLYQLERHALRVVRDSLVFGPTSRLYASAQIRQVRLRKTHLKWANRGLIPIRVLCHPVLLVVCRSNGLAGRVRGLCPDPSLRAGRWLLELTKLIQ